MRIPDAWSLQYQDENGAWQPVSGIAGDYPLPALDEDDPEQSLPAVEVSFDPVTTTALRLSLTRLDFDGERRATSVIEWEVWGTSSPSETDPDEPNLDGFLQAEEVAVRTTPGVAPELPGQMWVIDENGPLHYENVVWEPRTADQYATSGEFAVSGVIDGYEDQMVHATVQVAENFSGEIDSVAYAVTLATPGIAPQLPTTVLATYADGTVDSTVAVQWEEISADAYSQAGAIFDVAGTVHGLADPAMATVLVVEPIEQAEPLVAISIDTSPQGSGWYTSAPVVEITAEPTASPIATIEYSLDGGDTWETYTRLFELEVQGQISLTARATAEDGAFRTTTTELKVDTEAPTTAVEVQSGGTSATVALTAADGESGSGVSRTVWSDGPDEDPTGGANNMFATYEEPFSVQLTDEPRYVHVQSQDAAGNVEEYVTVTLPARGEAPPSAPSAPDVVVDGDEVTVSWSEPESATPITGYEALLLPAEDVTDDGPGSRAAVTADVLTIDVDGATLEATFSDVPVGEYRAAVIAMNDHGSSPRSALSESVTVATDPDPSEPPTQEPDPTRPPTEEPTAGGDLGNGQGPSPDQSGEDGSTPDEEADQDLVVTGTSALVGLLLATLLSAAGVGLVRHRMRSVRHTDGS